MKAILHTKCGCTREIEIKQSAPPYLKAALIPERTAIDYSEPVIYSVAVKVRKFGLKFIKHQIAYYLEELE